MREVREVRLYRLARRMVGDERPVPANVAWLKEHIVPGDVWGTYMAIRWKVRPHFSGPYWSAFWKALPKHPDAKKSQLNAMDKRLGAIERSLASVHEVITSNSRVASELLGEEVASLHRAVENLKDRVAMGFTGLVFGGFAALMFSENPPTGGKILAGVLVLAAAFALRRAVRP